MRVLQTVRGLNSGQLLILWLVLAVIAAPLALEVRRTTLGVSESQAGIDAWGQEFASAIAAGDIRRAELSNEMLGSAGNIGHGYYADRKRALYGMGALLVVGLSVTGVWLGRRGRVAFVQG